MQNITDNLQQKGFHLGLKLTQEELDVFRLLIEKHYLNILQESKVSNFDSFQNATIQNYHTLSHLVDHSKLWSKNNRILNQDAIDTIHQMLFFKTLQKEFGVFSVSDEEEIGREEFYFRLCRPHEPSDFGPLHADAWFWELGHGKMPEGKERIKVWIAIYVEKGLNGFRFVPHSHTQNIPYRGVKKEGFQNPKPQINISDEELDIQLFESHSGDMIIFHDRLVHGGAKNQGQYTRVSLEFTMLVDKK